MRSFSTRAAGLLILVLGVWGALVPFVGPYFHFTLGPTHSWTWTSGRLWLSVLPGAVAALGGLMLLSAGPRVSGKFGALLALAAGIWFAIGPEVSLLWNSNGAQGAAHGSVGIRALEMITYHTGLGAVIAALAGYALPGVLTRRVAVADAGVAAGAGTVAGRETAIRPARRPVDEPATAGETAALDREPVGVRGRAAADEPAATAGTAGVEREPAGVGAQADANRAEYAGAPDRGTYTNGGTAAERGGDYGPSGAYDTADAPASTEPATTSAPGSGATSAPGPAAASAPGPADTSAPVAPTDVRRRRRGGLLSAFRR